jgi:polar amino acid transport system substrate-binding protein
MQPMPARLVGLAFALAFALVPSSRVAAQTTPASPTRLECVADVYPPYTLESGGVVSGIGADLLVEAGRRAGVDIVVKLLPFARIENELKRGAASHVACAYAFSKTPEREAYMLFGTVPQSVTRYVLYAKSNKGGAYTGVNALQGARIGVRLAFRLPDAIKQMGEVGSLTLDAVNDDELNFRKLALGRLDFVLTNQDVGESMIRRLQLTDVHALRPAVAEFPTYVVFNKALEQAPAWRNAIDRGLQAVRTDRSEQRIREQYLR